MRLVKDDAARQRRCREDPGKQRAIGSSDIDDRSEGWPVIPGHYGTDGFRRSRSHAGSEQRGVIRMTLQVFKQTPAKDCSEGGLARL